MTLWLFIFEKLRFFLTSWRSMTKIAGAGAGSISPRHGSTDPDPSQNVTDQLHCLKSSQCLSHDRNHKLFLSPAGWNWIFFRRYRTVATITKDGNYKNRALLNITRGRHAFLLWNTALHSLIPDRCIQKGQRVPWTLNKRRKYSGVMLS